jgi:tol-pal system protein YbgF
MNRALPAVGVALVLAGCASRSSVRQLQSELTVVRKEVAALRQAHEETAREAARTRGEVNALETQIKELVATVGRATADVGRLTSQVVATDQDVKRLRADLAPKPTPAALPVEAPREPVVRPGAPEVAFNQALAMFRAREHGQAVLEFLDFIGKYPRHPLAAAAQYWIGEAYFVQRDYRQALVELQRVLEYPSPNTKAADALFEIGLCHVLLHDTAQARRYWQRVVKEYPDSDAATSAKRMLAGRAVSTTR